MISWRKVVECFKDSDYQVIRTINPEQEYWNQKTLYKGMIADDETVIYIVHSSVLPHVNIQNKVAVIILEDKVFEIIDLPKDAGNVLLVKEPEDIPTGIIALDAKFQEQFKIGYIMQKLLELVADNGGIQEVVEMVSQFFKEPIALLDTTFRFIARSQSYKPISGKSMFPDEAHYGEGYNKAMLEHFRKRGLLEKIINSMEPFSFVLADEEKAYYVPIIVNKIKVAYLIIYTNKPESNMEEYYLEYLPLFSYMISIELAKNNFYLFNKGNYYNYIFSLILSEDSVDMDDIRMRLKIYDYDLRENMYLVEIDTNMYKNVGLKKDRVAESLRNTFKNSFYVFNDDKIYFLISRHKYELVDIEEMNSWEMSLEGQKLAGAITGPFYGFEDIHKRIKEVNMVLEAVRNDKMDRYMYSFDEYQTKAMISYLQKEDMDMFLYKPVLRLIDYDEKHGSELVDTLKEFLSHPKEISSICENLCIHKNTLYKRLDKIDSIMGCDYRNGHEIMKIELTLEMLQK